MTEMILAREAFCSILSEGRTVREAASFLSEQCFELRLHAWAFVNLDTLQLVPHHIWPPLMWVALPDENGAVHFETEESSLVGNWLEGRLSYWPRFEGPLSERYNIQGLRFDRLEFVSIRKDVRQWSSEVIGATALPASAICQSSRATSVKAGRPPNDAAILAKADEMRARGIRDGRTIARSMRHELGFENVATTSVRALIKGRWPRGPAKGEGKG